MPDEGRAAAGNGDPIESVADADGGSESGGLGEQTTEELLPAREPLRTVFHTVGLLEQAIGVILILVILTLVLVQVGQRYLPGGGWAWTGEIARYAQVWVTFAMAGYLMAHDSQIAIKLVDIFLPPRVLGLVLLLGHALIAVVSVVMAYATVDFIVNDRGQVTPAAGIPLAIVYSVPAIGFVLTALRAALAVVVLDVRELRTGSKASP